MKVKLQPGGKLIVAIFFIGIFYLLLSVSGILGIFSSKNKTAATTDSARTVTKMPDRPIKIGYVSGHMPQNIYFANGDIETTQNSTANRYGLKVQLVECKTYTELADLVKTGGDKGGIDIAYSNLTQLSQKADLFVEAKIKCFLISDIVTEKNYLITGKSIKSIRELEQKPVSFFDINSSLASTAALFKKQGITSIKTDFCASDKASFDKLISNQTAGSIIKTKELLDALKNEKNYKILAEINNKLTNVLFASDETINEYYAYVKAAAKCCLSVSDSLKSKKQYNANTTFFDLNSNISYLNKKSFSEKSGLESEIELNNSALRGFISQESKTAASDFIYTKIIEELAQTKGNLLKTAPVKNPSLKTNAAGEIPQTTKPDTNKKVKPVVKQKPVQKEEKENTSVSKTSPSEKQASTIKKEPKGKKAKKENSDKPAVEPKSKSNKTAVKTKSEDKTVSDNYLMINFDPNSSDIDSAAKAKLSKVADEIHKSNIKEIVLTGHTDSTGEEAYNVMLSKKRAEIVMEHLNKNFGIDKNIFKTAGRGSSQPLGKNSDKKWKRLNRRVIITIKNK